jgi:hypothetical protein
MGQLLFVEERGDAVVVDAVVVDGPVSATVDLPGSQPLRSLVRSRLDEWAASATPLHWETLHRPGRRLRIGDGRTTVTLDLVA